MNWCKKYNTCIEKIEETYGVDCGQKVFEGCEGCQNLMNKEEKK